MFKISGEDLATIHIMVHFFQTNAKRRKAIESYASSIGMNPADFNFQLAKLTHELANVTPISSPTKKRK